MIEEIKKRLEFIEKQNNVKILYACESGSRAWGFASPDSDYDVRFIYARQANDYLSITTSKEVIEDPVSAVLDISGWDLRKALQLFLKSNAPLFEWLQSPVIYKTGPEFTNELTALMHFYFSLRAGCHHYLSMAKNGYENGFQSTEVKIKKYCYALRSTLAGLWIVEKNELPPMEFGSLRVLIKSEAWQSAVDNILELKKENDEKTLITKDPLLDGWFEETLSKIKEKSDGLPNVKRNTEQLNNLFRKYIR